MKTLLFALCPALCLLAVSALAAPPTFRVVTEDAPPFITTMAGEGEGPGKQFVSKLMQQAGLPYTHHVYPWARSMALAQRERHVLIYALARTPEREANFYWIGELLASRIHLYALNGSRTPVISSLEQARQLRLGVVNRDVRLDWLRVNGFADMHPGDSRGLDLSENTRVNMMKLRRGLVDVVPMSRGALQAYCRHNRIDCGQFRQVYTLPLTISMYLAASRSTPYEYVNTLRYHYRKLVQDGSHQQVFGDLNEH
ncbi:MAG: substrate-binding periplasmic protein [Vogesella sp.]|uniref:substrate-binding periplasmic protein n=1 Tax=Vogesella sp. TaxID=1904252 RepID=UPI00391A247B